MIGFVLEKFGINENDCTLTPIGNGLINHTCLVKTPTNEYILQEVNTEVFRQPNLIDENLKTLKRYLDARDPAYIFAAPLKSTNGDTLIYAEGGTYRMFDYVRNSVTINHVTSAKQAYEAAKQFGQFSRLLNDFDTSKLKATIPDFHNLTFRYSQYAEALKNSSVERIAKAKQAISQVEKYKSILDVFNAIQTGEIVIPKRVTHHDTKISNVLFDKDETGICVIDLDTVMPGYYFSDVGDMMRSYLAEASEEITDFDLIRVRPEIFKAIHNGYLAEMGTILTETEKGLFVYSGKFLMYMQAIRFLTDYLNHDVYYGAKYEDHNLNRSLNQLTLLNEYIQFTDKQ